jgi:hypothetical protein
MSDEAAIKDGHTFQEPFHVVYIVDASPKLTSLTLVVDSDLNEGNQLRCSIGFLSVLTQSAFFRPVHFEYGE